MKIGKVFATLKKVLAALSYFTLYFQLSTFTAVFLYNFYMQNRTSSSSLLSAPMNPWVLGADAPGLVGRDDDIGHDKEGTVFGRRNLL